MPRRNALRRKRSYFSKKIVKRGKPLRINLNSDERPRGRGAYVNPIDRVLDGCKDA